MIILNFSHPITDAQRDQIRSLTKQEIAATIDLSVQFDNDQPFLPQLESLMVGIPLSTVDLQTKPILVNPPSLNFIAAMLLAELHGRMGYFPPVIRTRPVAGSLPRQYEVAEILDLQSIRETSRKQR